MNIPYLYRGGRETLLNDILINESRVPNKKETSPSTQNFDEVKSGKISVQPNNSLRLQYWMKEGSGVTIPERLPL